MRQSLKERLVIIWFCLIIVLSIFTIERLINLVYGIIALILLLGLGFLVWLNNRISKD